MNSKIKPAYAAKVREQLVVVGYKGDNTILQDENDVFYYISDPNRVMQIGEFHEVNEMIRPL